MGQQRARAGDVDDDRVGEQDAARGARKVAPQQQVTIAVHHQHTLAGVRSSGQCRDDGGGRSAGVVTDPELEQVTQDDELPMRRRILAHESQESLDRARALVRQMQVGDDDRIDQWVDRALDRERRRRRGRAVAQAVLTG